MSRSLIEMLDAHGVVPPADPRDWVGMYCHLALDPNGKPGDVRQGEIVQVSPAKRRVAVQWRSFVDGSPTSTEWVALAAFTHGAALYFTEGQWRRAYETEWPHWLAENPSPPVITAADFAPRPGGDAAAPISVDALAAQVAK